MFCEIRFFKFISNMPAPVVSICIITYNQEKFLSECIESVLSQKINVPFEIVIGEDCSTDATLSIAEMYAVKHPALIRLLPKENENMGMHKNWERTITNADGKYVAIIEGDDMWIDPLKLQKQIDVLDKFPEVGLSFTDADVINEMDDKVFNNYVDVELPQFPNFFLLLKKNFIPTCSVVYRKSAISFSSAFFKSPYADWFLHLSCAYKSVVHYSAGYLSCAYRLHANGIFGGSTSIQRLKRSLKFYKILQKHYANDKTVLNNIKLLKIQLYDSMLKFYVQNNRKWKAREIHYKVKLGLYC